MAVDVSIQELPEPTGVERAQAVLLDALLARDDDVRLVLLARARVPERWRDHPRVTCAEGAGGPLWMWRETAVPRALREHDVRVVHSPVAALPLRARCPMVATIHEVPWAEDEPVEGADERAAHKLRLHLAANFAARLVVPSRRTAEAVLRLHPDVGSKLVVVPHGVDPRLLAEPGDAAVDAACASLGLPRGRFVLAVGRLRTKKNLALLLEAFARLRAAEADDAGPTHVLLVGPDGDASEALAERAARPDLAGRVVRAGFVDDATLAALYRGAAALAFPSRLEGFGLPALEAMACGTPAVVSREGPVHELVDGAARVVDGASSEAWASALADTCRRGPARDALVRAGHARAERHDAARAAATIVDLWTSLA